MARYKGVTPAYGSQILHTRLDQTATIGGTFGGAGVYGILPHRVADFVQLHDELCPLRCFRLGFGLEAAQLLHG